MPTDVVRGPGGPVALGAPRVFTRKYPDEGGGAMGGLDGFLDSYGLAAVFLVLLVKATGVPVPVPADALMLWTAARVAEGKVALGVAFGALLVALVAGGLVQFWLARGPGRGLLYRYGRYLGLTAARLDRASGAVRRGGLLGIAIAVATPGVRAATVAASGLAEVPLRIFLPGLALGSGAFLSLHFALGYVGGALLAGPLRDVPLPWLLGGVAALLGTALAGWLVLRRRQRPGATRGEVLAEAVGAWHEAACPACLLLGSAESHLAHLGRADRRTVTPFEPAA